MALSFCSYNHHQQLSVSPHSDVETDNDHQLLAHNDNLITFSDFSINPLFEFDDDLFYYDSYTNLLPYFSSSPTDNVMSLSHDTSLLQELEYCHYPKRRKSYADACHSSFSPIFFDGFIANSDPVIPDFPALVLPEFQVSGAAFNGGRSGCNSTGKKPSGESPSAQSIAARERRRKITEKTQELGKLVPGGNKMNTAEMLQAASKYVKFMQAQVKLLQLMEPMHQERKELNLHMQELQILLASPTVQEKLYSQEKCLVPRELLQTIANNE